MTLPAPVNAPSRPDPAELLDTYIALVRARGRRVWKNTVGPARRFLARWPDPQAFAAEPLEIRLAIPKPMQGFIAFLLCGPDTTT
jgi:hypothetical protein